MMPTAKAMSVAVGMAREEIYEIPIRVKTVFIDIEIVGKWVNIMGISTLFSEFIH